MENVIFKTFDCIFHPAYCNSVGTFSTWTAGLGEMRDTRPLLSQSLIHCEDKAPALPMGDTVRLAVSKSSVHGGLAPRLKWLGGRIWLTKLLSSWQSGERQRQERRRERSGVRGTPEMKKMPLQVTPPTIHFWQAGLYLLTAHSL